jgi:hypothetical protein
LIVAPSNFGASWLQARQARKGEVRRALLELWYVVTRIDQLLRLEPEAGKMVRLVNAQMSSKLPVLDHAIGLIRRRWLEPQLDDFAIEMNKALAAATMLAPLKLLPVLSGLTDVMGTANSERGPEWQRRWNKARTAYFVECRDLLGTGVLRPKPAPTRSASSSSPSPRA